MSIVLLKLKDFSRSQTVTYSVHVVISRKRCNVMILISSSITAILTILNDLHDHSPTSSLFTVFLIQLCSSWHDFKRHSASRGPSAIAELPVILRRTNLLLLTLWAGYPSCLCVCRRIISFAGRRCGVADWRSVT